MLKLSVTMLKKIYYCAKIFLLKGEKKRIAIDLDNTISNTIEVDYAMCWEYNQMINPSDNEFYSCNSSDAKLTVI